MMPRRTPVPVTGEVASPVQDGYAYVELDDAATAGSAVLAEECALAIAYNGIGNAVMMVSPSAVEDFVVGFSLTDEAVLRHQVAVVLGLKVVRVGAPDIGEAFAFEGLHGGGHHLLGLAPGAGQLRRGLLRRLDRTDEARVAYARALELVHSDPERRFLERRLAALG